jgi:hypothetical protein
MPARARLPRLKPRPRSAGLSPVLLVGAGTGEATCGILYLAGYLRRNGIEAYVRLYDGDESEAEVARSLESLVAHVKPRLVGISLKWFHHLARALLIAKTLRAIDPEVQIALGGNTASYFWQDLLAWDCVDHVVLGDGELPLLALSRGDPSPPNVVSRGASIARAPLKYVQGSAISDVYYSHFDEIFLSQLDLHSFSGWVAPGKGCGENCLYCGGTRGMQKATFGRATPFLRPEEAVQKDHREIAPRTWQMRYDFAGSTAEFLERAWGGVDLSRHSTTYFLWGVPPPALATTLSRTFERVYMVLDIGCFSELQRQEQLRRGLLKPCPSDAELFDVIDACRRHPNLELEISGIAGLPYASARSLEQERALVDEVLERGCSIGYQRLEAQPGALVTEHPERFEMMTEARTFQEFLDYFEKLDPSAKTVPMVRYRDQQLEAAVQRTSDEIDAVVWERAAALSKVELNGRSRLRNASASTQHFELGDWLGRYRVPGQLAREPVTVVRSVNGAGLSCAPSVSPRKFADPVLQQGEEASAFLAVLAAFEQPTRVDAAIAGLRKDAALDSESAREVIEHLAAGRFLQPA